MTHAELVQRAVHWLRGTKKCKVVFAEMTTSAMSIPDAIGWGPAWKPSMLVECKVSRSDFQRDRKKMSHRSGHIPGGLRWYMAPSGVLTPQDISYPWGLLEVRGSRVFEVVKPTLAEDRDMGEELCLLVSAVHRHQLGVEWFADTARFKPMGTTTPKEDR